MKGVVKYIYLVPTFFLTGCFTASTFDMEGLQPAEITISPSVSTLSVLARMDLDTVYKTGSVQKAGKNAFELDSLLAKEAVVGCVDALLESPRYKVFDPVITRSLTGDYTNPGRLIPWPILLSTAGNPPVDGVLALESYFLSDTLILRNEDGWSYIEQQTRVNTTWRLYQLDQLASYDFTCKQTLTWDRGSDPEEIKSSRIQKEIFKESMYKTGQEAARKIAPFWSKLYRIYFPFGNEDFTKAASFLREGNWRDAASIWNRYVNSKNRFTSSKARFNMAVAAEMAGNPSLAMDWLKKSAESGMLPYYVEYYGNDLQKRAKIKSTLDNQMVNPTDKKKP
jgi:hypothetical protein